MNKFILRISAGILISVMLAISMGAYGCVRNKDEPVLVSAYKASVQLSAYGNSAAESILKAYQNGQISLELKDKIFDDLGKVSKAGRAFHEEIKALQAKFPDGIVPGADVLKLEVLFDSTVYGPFLDILELAKVLPADQRATVELAIAALKAAISTIRHAFSKSADLASLTIFNASSGNPDIASLKMGISSKADRLSLERGMLQL